MPLNALDIGNASPGPQEAISFAAAPGTSTPSELTTSAAAFGLVMAQTLQEMSPDGADAGHGEIGQVLAIPTDMEQPTAATPSVDGLLMPAWMQSWPSTAAVEQIHVGPSLQAITAKNATPDDASLLAFAKAQGLDAQAIAWLLGPHDAHQVVAETVASADLQAQAGPVASGAGISPASSTAGPGAWLSLQASTTPVPAGPAISPSPALPAGTSGPAAIVNAAAWTAPRLVQPDSATDSAPESSPPLTDAGNTPALSSLRWAQLNTISNGAATQTPANRYAAASPGSGWQESELDLGELSTQHPDDAPELASGADMPSLAPHAPSPRDMPGLAAHTPSAANLQDNKINANAPAMAQSTGQEQMELLADQMADAIGERMIQELERGHWNLRLMLKPAHLGHIEVEMRMRAGELDASFAAPQAATRELLQDGLARLKESLNQMGMDVASLDVRTGQNRQNGGDPTPNQKTPTSNFSNRDTTEMPSPPTNAFVPRPRRADGWDVMV